MSNMLLLCFTGHVLGNYYLQSDKVARYKNEKFTRLLYHALIYSIPFAVIFGVSGLSLQLGAFLLSACVAHFAIDLIKIDFYKCGLYKTCSDKYKLKEPCDYSRYTPPALPFKCPCPVLTLTP